MSGRSLLPIIALGLLIAGTVSAATPLISGTVVAGGQAPATRRPPHSRPTPSFHPGPRGRTTVPKTAATVQVLKPQPSLTAPAKPVLAAPAVASPHPGATTVANRVPTTIAGLAPGATGAAVWTLQSALTAAGFSPGAPDGIYGPATREKVVAFQAAHGLAADGWAGPLTMVALSPFTSSTPVVPASTPPAAHLSSSPLIWAYSVAWSDTSFDQSWSQHGPSIGVLSPYWYTLNSAGQLSQHGLDHSTVVAKVHAQGAEILPLVNNGKENDLIFSGPQREEAINNLVAEAETADLDGYNIDFEGLNASDRSGLTSFVTALAQRLHPLGKVVTVAVGAKTGENPVSNPAGYAYDYAALGAVADRVVIMTYDRHSDGSAAGPVAPLPWVRAVAAYASSLIPPSKILLGLADYGYDWGPNGTTSLSAVQIESTLGNSQWDPTSAESHLTYGSGAATHQVWYEDGASAASKAQLVSQYGLGGVALWYLGGEDSAFWPDLQKALGN